MTITLLFFLVGLVVMQGLGQLTLGNSPSVDGPLSTLSFACPSSSRASYLLCRGTWEGDVCSRGFTCCAEQKPASTSPCLLVPVPLLGFRGVGEPSFLV